MCNHCANLDPRDELAYGAKALNGLADLVSDIQAAGGSFERTSPGEFAELLDLVRGRIDAAADRLQGYIPRD